MGQSEFKRNPEKEYWQWALGIGAGLAVLLAALALLFWLDQSGPFGGVPGGMRTKLLLFVAVIGGATVLAVLLLLRMFFGRYVFPLFQLGEDLEALLHGSRGTRLHLAEGAYLGALERGLNQLVERHDVTEEIVERRLNEALGELGKEKQGLESLLEALSEGVVVSDLDGKVLRYNSAAKRLLDRDNFLGLGRSIYNLVEKPLCDYALETIGGQFTDEGARPFARFEQNRESGERLLVRVAPLRGEGAALQGFILTFEDPAEHPPTLRSDQAAPPPRAGAGAAEAPFSVEARAMPLSELRYVVFDTETTGLMPSKGDEIISIGAVAIAGGRVLHKETYEQLVDPERPPRPSSIKIHGITPEMLEGQPTIGEALPAFSRFAHEAVLVAHNAAFDMRFLKEKESSTGIRFDQPVLDTLLLSSVLHPNQSSHSLDTLLARYGIPAQGRHTALGDALMTADLFLKLLPQLEQRGITTLGTALEASRNSPLARISF